jgi:hypothetical protein
MTAAPKKSLLPAIHAQRRNTPGLAEEADWRAFLKTTTGQESLRDMTPAQHKRVLAKLLPNGKPHHGKPRHVAGDQMGKIRAEWIEIAKLGGVENGDEEALAAWIAKTSGQDIGLLDVKTASRLIEQLKRWRQRLEKKKP